VVSYARIKRGIRMTDEKMAEEYALNDIRYGTDDGEPRSPIDIAEEAFLAGLKAGRLKWHDLRKNLDDLPLEGEKDYITNIGVMTFTSLHDRLIWTTPLCEACDYYEEVTDEVIAWCEIPKYTEE
jgi:hypothetical protein